MIENWWQAHMMEFVISGAILGSIILIILIYFGVGLIKRHIENINGRRKQ